jgi:type III secretory pathway component EscS
MAIVSNPVVYVSGAIGTIVAPVAAIQQTKLTEVAAMKETIID